MAFKMKGFSAGAGTGSAMKKNSAYKKEMLDENKDGLSDYVQGPEVVGKDIFKAASEPEKKEEVKKEDPYTAASKRDPNLASYVKKRKTLEKGSAEYNANQNRINKAYDKGPMRDQTTKTKENNNKKVEVTNTPGVSNVKVKTKDNKKKTTTTNQIKGTVTKNKIKAGKDGEMGTADDKNKTRTRRKFSETGLGKSGLGQKFVKKENKTGGINAAADNQVKPTKEQKKAARQAKRDAKNKARDENMKK